MSTQETASEISEIHEFYVSQINALVASDREDVIPSLTAEYEHLNEEREAAARAA